MNLARKKFFGLFISSLGKVQTVCFEKLASVSDSRVKAELSLRRIQRFISEYSLDSYLVARFIISLLPHEPAIQAGFRQDKLEVRDEEH
jgi:hypothetical protein